MAQTPAIIGVWVMIGRTWLAYGGDKNQDGRRITRLDGGTYHLQHNVIGISVWH